jgi:putative ABC transport system permease protein
LKTQEDLDPQILGERESGINSFLSWSPPIDTISERQNKLEHQGFLGFLFIGFTTAALLTVLAFLLHVVFSFQRRFIKLGGLRAAGLSMGQMTGYLVWELSFLIAIESVIGTTLGYYASVRFIPIMQVGWQTVDLIPPFEVLITWESIYQIDWMFGIIFFVILIVSIVLLRRLRIFQAIKLSETL